MTHMQICDSEYVTAPSYIADHISEMGSASNMTKQRGFHLMFHFQDFCGENFLWQLIRPNELPGQLDKLRCAWELCVLLSFTSMALWLQRSSALHAQMCSEVF